MSRSLDQPETFEPQPAEKPKRAAFNFSQFKDKNANTSSFLDSFATQYGFDFGKKEDEEADTPEAPAVGAPSQEPANDGLTLSQRRRAARDLQKLNRDARVNTQQTTRQTNANAQDFIRGGLSGELQQERQIFTQNDASDAVASEINQRVDSAMTDATASDPFDNRPDQTDLSIYSQSDLNLEDVNVTDRLLEAGIDIGEAQSSGIDLSGIATEDDLTTQRTEVDNTLTSVTENDPGVSNLGGDGSDTSGLAIYDQEDDTGIDVPGRLLEAGVDIGDSQYRDSGDEIDPDNEIESEIRLRMDRQEDAYQDNVENDPSDAQRGITEVSEGYNPPSDFQLPDIDFTTPSPEYNPGYNLGTPSDDEPAPPVTTPDPGGDLGIGDEADQRETSPDSSGGRPITTLPPPSRANDPTWGGRTTLNMNTMEPIGRRRGDPPPSTSADPSPINESTTDTQQQGSSAAEEINVEAETRSNQQALQSNEIVASGGSDTALMQAPDAEQSVQQESQVRTADFQDSNNNGTDDRDEQWHQQGFQDEGEMQRFEDKYANYVQTAGDVGHLNVDDSTKDNMREAFFRVDRPAYEYDQKIAPAIAVYDEKKQRGVEDGTFNNMKHMNKTIGFFARNKDKWDKANYDYMSDPRYKYIAENNLHIRPEGY